MADQPETRLVTRERPDGQVEISVYDPRSGREIRTGQVASRARADEECRKVAEALKRAGNRVSHKQL